MLNWKLDAAISCFILDTVIPKRCAVSGTHDVDVVVIVVTEWIMETIQHCRCIAVSHRNNKLLIQGIFIWVNLFPHTHGIIIHVCWVLQQHIWLILCAPSIQIPVAVD
jgi:protein-S-isoprenylcysteine O-methyltransferase Ste14